MSPRPISDRGQALDPILESRADKSGDNKNPFNNLYVPTNNSFVGYRYVKLSSPNINNILLWGCIITYSSVFMESLHQNSAVLCKVMKHLNTAKIWHSSEIWV